MAIVSSHQPSPDPLLQPRLTPADRDPVRPEDTLRPQKLQDYIGQKELKEVLAITLAAARARQEPLDHLLFYGPPGLGKTTIAAILAAEMGGNFYLATAPALESPRDIAGYLVRLQRGDVLFIDEIHRLPRVTEELLYPAMEDFRLDITTGKGRAARITSVPLPRFTLIGATTRIASLTAPLRDRFGLVQRLRFYEVDELQAIVLRTAQLLPVSITPAGAQEIAQRSRGTPRIANRLLKRVRDFALVYGHATITAEIAATALERLQVDPQGLDWTDRKLLTTMIERFQGAPVGLDTLAAATGEDPQTIEDVYEPYLLQIGYLQRTPRGRVATSAALAHLGYIRDPGQQTEIPLSTEIQVDL